MLVTEKKRTWQDAFGAVRMGLAPTRLVVGFIGLAALWVLWGLYPAKHLSGGFGTLLVNLVWMTVSLWWLYVIVAGLGRSAYLELEEGEGPGLVGLLGFTFSKGLLTGFAALILVAGSLMFLGLATVGFLLGRIPGVGSWLAAVLYFPMLAFVVLGVMALVLAAFGLFVASGAAGVRKAGALDTFLDTLDLFSGRGVFWAFLLTLVVLEVLGQIIGLFLGASKTVLALGAGSVFDGSGAVGVSPFATLYTPFYKVLSDPLGVLWPAALPSGLWGFVDGAAMLLGGSYLLGVFAASGVVAYIVGTEDEVVVVEEKKPVSPRDGGSAPAEAAGASQPAVAKAPEPVASRPEGAEKGEKGDDGAGKPIPAEQPHEPAEEKERQGAKEGKPAAKKASKKTSRKRASSKKKSSGKKKSGEDKDG